MGGIYLMCESEDKKKIKHLNNVKYIFIVEDEPDLQDLYAAYLKQDSWTIHQAINGINAIKMYEKFNGTNEPDIVLIDINLPGCSGIEVAETILDMNPKQKIIFISANLDLLWKNPKFVSFHKFRKPISLRKLTKQLNTIISEISEHECINKGDRHEY